jgi:hypothetical protein
LPRLIREGICRVNAALLGLTRHSSARGTFPGWPPSLGESRPPRLAPVAGAAAGGRAGRFQRYLVRDICAGRPRRRRGCASC